MRQEIPVVQDSDYSGQEMDWTERLAEIRTIEKPMKVYHYSQFHVIESFQAKPTCFWDCETGGPGYIYEYIIPAGTEIAIYEHGKKNEIRCHLLPGQSLFLIGQREIVGRTEKNGYVKYEYETEWYSK